MNTKFSKKELLEMIDSKLIDLTEEEIKELINKELNKDNSVIDMEYVDICFDLLEAKKAMQDTPEIKEKKIGIRKPVKIIFIAAVFIVFMITTLTVSAQVLNFNIPKEISNWIEGNAKTDINLKLADTTADKYSLEDSDLVRELETQSLSPITLPEELIKESSEIIKVDNITTDKIISTDVEIKFNYNNTYGLLSISQYVSDLEWTGEMIINDVLSAEMIKVNGMDVLIFENENSCNICYKDNFTTYEIYLETDFETAKQFAQSIK